MRVAFKFTPANLAEPPKAQASGLIVCPPLAAWLCLDSRSRALSLHGAASVKAGREEKARLWKVKRSIQDGIDARKRETSASIVLDSSISRCA